MGSRTQAGPRLAMLRDCTKSSRQMIFTALIVLYESPSPSYRARLDDRGSHWQQAKALSDEVPVGKIEATTESVHCMRLNSWHDADPFTIG
jgi:hypothetical protein